MTLTERGSFEIYRECDWEDDGQDDADADVVRGGPNGRLSLTAARELYGNRGHARCNDGWICEQHPEQGWPHDDCAGPGMPCAICQPPDERPRLPDDWRSIVRVDDE